MTSASILPRNQIGDGLKQMQTNQRKFLITEKLLVQVFNDNQDGKLREELVRHLTALELLTCIPIQSTGAFSNPLEGERNLSEMLKLLTC